MKIFANFILKFQSLIYCSTFSCFFVQNLRTKQKILENLQHPLNSAPTPVLEIPKEIRIQFSWYRLYTAEHIICRLCYKYNKK